jgi:hypothetical protein
MLKSLLTFLFASSLFAQEKTAEPFAFADFTWLNGNSRQSTPVLDTKYFTGQFQIDSNYVYSFHRPTDHSLSGSTNSGRTNEIQVQQFGIGGDFHVENVRGRFMTQFGMYSTMTPRNDSSPSRGQWDLSNAYRYISEAYAGYHWDVLNGINLDAGIFMSYIGLCSYYNFENWVYQMSYVSANTPWFFNGLRLQIFPTEKFKAELWLVNGWQAYGMFNEAPGVGFQLLWRPNGMVSVVSNNYYGYDTLGTPNRVRIHTDNSVQIKYYDKPNEFFSKAAFSVTADAGCENGGGVQCSTQNFLGFMVYNRAWFYKDLFAFTLGGGAISNPGRYLVLVPPINGATATNGTPFLTTNDGSPFTAWDTSATFDYMPNPYITFRTEFIHRETSIPYFSGPGGISSATPDLQKYENRINLAMMVRL